jgi:chromosomal replication initiation ATPase DnaA
MKKLTWYHELGFYTNPFSIKPAAFHNELFGYDDLLAEINEKVEHSNIVFIHGPYGTGKTTILKGIIDKFRGKKRVIYYNCNKAEGSIHFDKLLINAGCLFHKIFRIKKKKMIILIDEAQDLNKKDMASVIKYYNTNYFKSVILVSKKEDVNLPSTLKKAIPKANNYHLGVLSNQQAILLVRKRVGDLQFIPDEMITKIFKKNKNPRAFLKNCEEVCRNAFELGTDKVSEKHIDKFAIN